VNLSESSNSTSYLSPIILFREMWCMG